MVVGEPHFETFARGAFWAFGVGRCKNEAQLERVSGGRHNVLCVLVLCVILRVGLGGMDFFS